MTTKNTGWAKAGIHSINHFALALPDLAEAEKFMVAYGLRVDRRGTELHVRASASEHVWLKVVAGAKKSFEFLSVGCYAEDFDQIRQQVIKAGGVESVPHLVGSPDGFWFKDPDGTLLQLRVAPKMMPDSKVEMEDGNVPAGIQGAAFRSTMQKVGPSRLAHMLLFAPLRLVGHHLGFEESGRRPAKNRQILIHPRRYVIVHRRCTTRWA